MNRICILFFVLMFFGCQTKIEPQDDSTQIDSTLYNDNISVLHSVDQVKNDKFPNFTWYDSNGKKITFTEFSTGKPVVINFWATWCGPCIKETPDLVELDEEYSSQGALFLGISADLGDDAMELVVEFVKEYKVQYQMVIDNNGDLQEAFGGLRGYPTTFIVDKNGKIVKKLLGIQSKKKLAEELKLFL